LAVLSACDTNVGVHRAGQSIKSLQSALRIAGARSAVTSLWRVRDKASADLMQNFYRLLLVEGLSKGDALWEAKRVLRRNGAEARDWAAWILTGDPDDCLGKPRTIK